jgi:acetolactate synthase-1/2/3 large subunit
VPEELSGAEIVAQVLANSGTGPVFMLHGAHIDPIYRSCIDRGIRIVSVRHEAAAGHAAEGYARASGGLGIALITAGPGVTNIVTSMANASLDRTPVLYLAGSAPDAEDETSALQSGIDQVALARPVTKWAHRIKRTDEISRLLAQAIRIATTPPTGPIFVEIPGDVLAGVTEQRRATVPERIILSRQLPPQPGDIDTAIQLLSTAERPAIMAGGGICADGAASELQRFAQATSLPVFAQFDALGVIPSGDPLWVGTFWQLSQLPPPIQPDLVLALGVRFGWHAPGFRSEVAAGIIHVEVDPKEIGRPRPPCLAIVAGSEETLRALNDRTELAGQWPDRSAWIGQMRSAIRQSIEHASALPPGPHDGIHPCQVARTVSELAGPDAVIVGDGAFAKHWLDDVIACSRPGSYFTHGSLGAMGIGLGLAMGVRLADPGRPVLCVTGDGSVGFTIAEFDSMVRHDIPIVVVVMNNHSWGNPQLISSRWGGTYPTVGTALGGARYADVAVAFGGFGRTVTTQEELAPALRDAFASGLPSCIDVHVMLQGNPAPSMAALHLA